jgi:hypothetical protein
MGHKKRFEVEKFQDHAMQISLDCHSLSHLDIHMQEFTFAMLNLKRQYFSL